MDGPTPKPRRGLHFPGTKAKGEIIEMPAQTQERGAPLNSSRSSGWNESTGLRLLRCPFTCGQGLLDQIDAVTCLSQIIT